LIRSLKAEAPRYATLLPQIPRLLHQQLASHNIEHIETAFKMMLTQQTRRNQLLGVGVLLLAALVGVAVFIALRLTS
jgi:ubiquinone biosynthesis protein